MLYNLFLNTIQELILENLNLRSTQFLDLTQIYKHAITSVAVQKNYVIIRIQLNLDAERGPTIELMPIPHFEMASLGDLKYEMKL